MPVSFLGEFLLGLVLPPKDGLLRVAFLCDPGAGGGGGCCVSRQMFLHKGNCLCPHSSVQRPNNEWMKNPAWEP